MDCATGAPLTVKRRISPLSGVTGAALWGAFQLGRVGQGPCARTTASQAMVSVAVRTPTARSPQMSKSMALAMRTSAPEAWASALVSACGSTSAVPLSRLAAITSSERRGSKRRASIAFSRSTSNPLCWAAQLNSVSRRCSSSTVTARCSVGRRRKPHSNSLAKAPCNSKDRCASGNIGPGMPAPESGFRPP